MKKIYQTRAKKLSGTQYAEIYQKAFDLYCEIRKKSKRRPYIRSKYFGKDKIFLELFWRHLHQKNWRDRARRLPYFPCALELIINCSSSHESKDHPTDYSQTVHRFIGATAEGSLFRVQIKEDKKTKQKCLMSVFPINALEE